VCTALCEAFIGSRRQPFVIRATFSTSEIGLCDHFAQQQIVGPDVRFGSKADIRVDEIDVLLFAKSRHSSA
jgi:hypothetical protein